MVDISKWTAGVFVPNKRSIGGIVAQVTISETERDELFISEHPVEVGAPISDHAYKRPSEVNIRAGWSAGKTGDLSANGNGMYGILLSWQAALQPFDLYTGKRTYHSMLISALTVTTDQSSEFALMADITCRQVILVSTSPTQAAISSNPENQASPENNATTQDHGDQQPADLSLDSPPIPPPSAQNTPIYDSSGNRIGTEAPLPPPIPGSPEQTAVEKTVIQNTPLLNEKGVVIGTEAALPPPIPAPQMMFR
jgi:hypothetical protein